MGEHAEWIYHVFGTELAPLRCRGALRASSDDVAAAVAALELRTVELRATQVGGRCALAGWGGGVKQSQRLGPRGWVCVRGPEE